MATISIKWGRPRDRLLPSLQKYGVSRICVSLRPEDFLSLDVKFDRNGIARYGLPWKTSLIPSRRRSAGARLASSLSGDRRYEIVVRVPDVERNDLEALRALPVMLPVANGSHREFLTFAGAGPLRVFGRIE